MHKLSALIVVCCAGILASACASVDKSKAPSDSVAITPATQTASGEPWSVRLERGACFGTCPMYVVDLNIDGTVKFTGNRFVIDTVQHTSKVSVESVRALQSQMNAAGFSAMPNYVNGEQACGRWHTDAPRVTMSVTSGGNVRTVIHDYGCSDVPAIVKTLETAIDSIAGTSQWMAPAKSGKP